MNNIFEFNQNDWLWIINLSLFIFGLIDGITKGKEAIEKNINESKEKLNKKIISVIVFALYFLTMYLLYFVFFEFLNQVISFIILTIDVCFRLYDNTFNTKRLSDYDNE